MMEVRIRMETFNLMRTPFQAEANVSNLKAEYCKDGYADLTRIGRLCCDLNKKVTNRYNRDFTLSLSPAVFCSDTSSPGLLISVIDAFTSPNEEGHFTQLVGSLMEQICEKGASADIIVNGKFSKIRL